jgi:hypothetical protein
MKRVNIIMFILLSLLGQSQAEFLQAPLEENGGMVEEKVNAPNFTKDNIEQAPQPISEDHQRGIIFKQENPLTPAVQYKTVNPASFSQQVSKSGLSNVIVTTLKPDITIWDHGIEDGDRVTILVNGKPFIENLTILHLPKSFSLELGEGDNIITVRALNEGYVSPNTASIKISSVTQGKAEQVWDLDQNENGEFKITVLLP